MCPFTNNHQFPPPRFNIATELTLPQPPELEKEPATLGEHLRRKRIELGLEQKELAAMLGVSVSTIWNWENGWSINWQYYPQIIRFLGYNPIPIPEGTIQRLEWYKRIKGLDLVMLGKELGRHPEQVSEWLRGVRTPCKRNMRVIEEFLEERLEAMPTPAAKCSNET
ncbi:helix-turn-helix protein [Geothermobacter ehrlichii]|uniref:Helix-turn-helix protein n=1 Tax=Geothermobacter ehrlichii TaxID=213224 RepID=A0A5D3WHM0_9BACT|nr:helix-turn-helix transcriptional regulator [Geothermobacter ehrlichii]TYO96719.1 helix-turn-helix protein [Geothermobacter ehrlichii]